MAAVGEKQMAVDIAADGLPSTAIAWGFPGSSPRIACVIATSHT
jgi:hypothetical protein